MVRSQVRCGASAYEADCQELVVFQKVYCGLIFKQAKEVSLEIPTGCDLEHKYAGNNKLNVA